jgi:hypothetical protein
MMSVEAGEEDFASDSSSSRPGSRAAHTPDFRRGGAGRQGALPPAVEWRPRNRARRFAEKWCKCCFKKYGNWQKNFYLKK